MAQILKKLRFQSSRENIPRGRVQYTTNCKLVFFYSKKYIIIIRKRFIQLKYT